MKKIENENIALENLPIYDFQFFQRILKIKCSEISRYSHNDYIFDVLSYNYNGNGSRTIKMYDNEGNEYLKDYEINIGYAWGAGYHIRIKKANSKIIKHYTEYYSEERLEIHFEHLIEICSILMGTYFEDSLISDFFKIELSES